MSERGYNPPTKHADYRVVVVLRLRAGKHTAVAGGLVYSKEEAST